MTRRFGELTAADIGMPFKHGGVEGVLTSLRHFVDHEKVGRTIAFVQVPPAGPDKRIFHREVPALSSDTIGGAS